MVRIIMHGCNGKMGQVITRMAAEDKECEIVAGIDTCEGRLNGYPVFDSLQDCDVEADVVIDFSNAKAVDGLLENCKKRRLPVVLCTTGLSKEQIQKVEDTAKETAVLKSANMSLGINTLAKIVELITPVLADAGFDIEIVERHHRRKLDAPSGTAIMLGNAANKSLNGEYHFVFDRSERREKRDPKEIGFSAVRGGTIVGVHDVIYAGEDEVIELNHQAFSRGVFAKGAVQAAKFLQGKEPGVYTMRDVIG